MHNMLAHVEAAMQVTVIHILLIDGDARNVTF